MISIQNKEDIQAYFENIFSGQIPDTKAMAMKVCFDLQPHVASIICKNYNEFFSDGMLVTLG